MLFTVLHVHKTEANSYENNIRVYSNSHSAQYTVIHTLHSIQ